MKKIFNITLALACVVTLALAFTACTSTTCASHSDIDKNGYCDMCSEPFTCPGHKDANNDKMCDFCLADYSHKDHYDEDEDFKCDQCGAPYMCLHEDADADEICDLCMCEFICPAHADQNKDGVCDECKAPYVCPGHVDANGDKSCDVCKAPYTCGSAGHKDADADGNCDVCKAPFECDGHVDYGSDGRCDKCNGVFVCSVHFDLNGDEKCDNCQAHYVAPQDLRAGFVNAAKATDPKSMVVTVTTKYEAGPLTSKYTVTINEDGTVVIVAEIQKFNEELTGDAIITLPPVTISQDENGVYTDGYDFEYLQPSAERPVIDFMKLKPGTFNTPDASVLKATVAAADTASVLGIAYPYDVTLIVNKNETELTSISITYSNVNITCVYTAK